MTLLTDRDTSTSRAAPLPEWPSVIDRRCPPCTGHRQRHSRPDRAPSSWAASWAAVSILKSNTAGLHYQGISSSRSSLSRDGCLGLLRWGRVGASVLCAVG